MVLYMFSVLGYKCRSGITGSYGDSVFHFLRLNKYTVPLAVNKDTNLTAHLYSN